MDLHTTNQAAEYLCKSNAWGTARFVSNGNSAAVYEVSHPTHGRCALKIYDPTFFHGSNALIETRRVELQLQLKNHGHPHLIEMIDANPIPSFNTWYLLMEYCDWPCLEDVLSKAPNDRISLLIDQLTDAVIFLEGKSLVHRDIKPANISVSPDFSNLKLLDLGVMRHVGHDEGNGTDDSEKRRFVATAQYSPPEYFTRDEPPGAEGFAAMNVYQVGAVLHDLIMKEAIFSEEVKTDNKYILYKAVTSKRPRVVNPDVPVGLVSLCNSALEKDPIRRLASVELSNFRATFDSSDTVRRRVGALMNSTQAATTPSIMIWKRRVRDLVRAAARKERNTIGAFNMSELPFETGAAWSLSFPSVNRSVQIELAPLPTGCLELYFVANTSPPLRWTVAEVTANGFGMSDDDVTTTLSEHILYGVDVAQCEESGTLIEVASNE